MTDPKTTIKEIPNDNFTIVEQISKKYFLEIEHSVSHLQQTLFDLQNACYNTWENTVNANLLLQREFATTAGFNFVMPDTAQEIIASVSEEIVKYRSVWNKIVIATIESGTANVKTWNDNANMFADLNQKIMQSWLSALTPK